jgi:hypothetical protein
MRAPAQSSKRQFVKSEESDCPTARTYKQSRHFLQLEKGGIEILEGASWWAFPISKDWEQRQEAMPRASGGSTPELLGSINEYSEGELIFSEPRRLGLPRAARRGSWPDPPSPCPLRRLDWAEALVLG